MSAASPRQMVEQIALCGVPSRKKKSGTRGGYYIGSCIAMETLLTVRENALNWSRGTQTCNFVFCESGRKGSEIEAVELK